MTEAGPNLTAWLSQRPRPLLGGIALAMFLLVAVIRYETSPRLDITLFFLIPVSFALWFVSRTLGWFFVAIAVAIMLHFDHLHWGRSWDTVEFWNAMMSGATLAVFAVIFSEVRGLYQRAQMQSLQDSLTGLANRRAFLALLAAENRRMRREGKPLTLAYVDVDDFKHVNDKLGHTAGDALLRSLARCMESVVRASDTVGRLGGDEFAVLLPDTTEPAAKTVVGKLQERLLQCGLLPNHTVTLSIGAVTFERDYESAEKMLEQADQAMYAVKQSGKNRVEYRLVSPAK
jgi:diguanylate cyclase (GGDEF)-like protein